MPRGIIRCLGRVMLAMLIFCAGQESMSSEDILAEGTASGSGGDMAINERSFPALKNMEGFSEALIEDHLALYRGYVENSSRLLLKLNDMIEKRQGHTPEYAELKRRLGWEMNGAILHEYYFENLGGSGIPDANSLLYEKILEDFGSYDVWREDFISTGKMRGIGWVVLCQDPLSGRLLNMWINEHDAGHLGGAEIILVMDVFEHAYMTDYRLNRTGYIDAFFRNIDWDQAERRFSESVY